MNGWNKNDVKMMKETKTYTLAVGRLRVQAMLIMSHVWSMTMYIVMPYEMLFIYSC